MAKPTILLTGANGFLGSHLLEALLSQQYNVVILKRSTSDLWRIAHLMDQVTSYDVDVQPLQQAFKEQEIDCVIHTACHYGRNGDSIHSIVESNLLYGIQVLEAAIECNVKTFVNTDTCLPKEISIYSLSKKQFLEWAVCTKNKINIINIKLENIYGPKDDANKFISWLILKLKTDVASIPLTSGDQKRDFIYIDDAVSAYMFILNFIDIHQEFDEYEVCNDRLVAVKDVVVLLKRCYQDKRSNCKTILDFGALPYRDNEKMEYAMCNDKLKRLGWKSKTNLDEGLQKCIDYELMNV